MKPKIRVFPDYCSSGLWDVEGVNLDEAGFETVLGTSNLLALKYWHNIWEFEIACFDDSEKPRVSEEYIKEWDEDGQKLVEQFNKCQDTYEFVYCGEYE